MTDAGKRFVRELTLRERTITRLLCTSTETEKVLAARLGIRHGTIKNHAKKIYVKAGMDGRMALAMFCFANGVVACPCGANARPAGVA